MRTLGPEPDPGHASGGLAELWRHRRLLWEFTLRDLQRQYVGSSLGFFWTVITPLLELLTFTFVFHGIIGVKFGDPSSGWTHYALYLFCGMVTWKAFGDGLSRCAAVVTDHGHLVKKVNFPVIILPGSVIASGLLNQVIRLGVLLLAAVVIGDGLSWHLIFLPLLLALHATLTLGAGLLLSTANVYFRDTTHWVNNVLMMWMFVTPVFYPADALGEKFNLLLQLNPLAHVVGIFQQVILNQTLPDLRQLLIVSVIAGLSVLVGYSVFLHHRDRFADLV